MSDQTTKRMPICQSLNERAEAGRQLRLFLAEERDQDGFNKVAVKLMPIFSILMGATGLGRLILGA